MKEVVTRGNMSDSTPGSSEALFDNSRIVLTYRELAHALGVSEGSLRLKVHRRQIPHVKVGHNVRFIREDIVQWLRKGAVDVS